LNLLTCIFIYIVEKKVIQKNLEENAFQGYLKKIYSLKNK